MQLQLQAKTVPLRQGKNQIKKTKRGFEKFYLQQYYNSAKALELLLLVACNVTGVTLTLFK
jgi:hypothetical protein